VVRRVICSFALIAAATTARPVLGTGVPVAEPLSNTRPHIYLTSEQRASITSILTQAMAKQKIPGMVVALAVAGHPIYERAFGDRASGKPADISTIFPIGSITKQFTAACVMWLSEKHRLDLDSPVSRYAASVPHGDEITVRELLDQTTGLVSSTEQPVLQQALRPLLYHGSSVNVSSLNVSSSQALALISNKPLKFRPGTRYDYSNTNYLAAGMVVAAVSGETYQHFLREHILIPLGLKRTQYLHTSIPEGDDVARGYTISNGTDHPVVLPKFSLTWAGSAGALASDVADLVRWDDAFFHGRVVPAAVVRTMTTPVKSDYGYGWAVYYYEKGSGMPWHNGGFPGAHAMNLYYPPADMEVIVLTNLEQAHPEEIATQVLGAALHRHQLPVVQRARLSARELASVTGLYDLGPGGNGRPGGLLEVTRRGSRLFAAFPPQPEAEIIPVRDGDTNSIECRWKWSISNDWNTSIKFFKGPRGAVTRAIYQSGVGRIIAPKLAVTIDPNVDPRTYAAFVGQYAFAKGAPLMSITRHGRHLFAQYASGPTYEIFPDSPTEFFWNTTNAQITFNRGRDGAITGATMHLRGGSTQKMTRVAQMHVE
jgi:CubicO group peptidase (beta-lactamase class C family)